MCPEKGAFVTEFLSVSGDRVLQRRLKGEQGVLSAHKSSFFRCGNKIEMYKIIIIQIIKMHQRKSFFTGKLTFLLRKML